MQETKDLVESVLYEFEHLARIPRPSGHEKAVSDYLFSKLKEMGLSVVQDEKYNIIADKPASIGAENAKLTVLQAHMDMVCLSADGVAYNPWKDPIRTVRDGDYLKAEGTTLGADDGIGIAEILYILQTVKVHGPLRAIFTVDEEQGMSGAIHLDKKYLEDASYLINCDSEEYDVVTIGCAGSLSTDFTGAVDGIPSAGGFAYQLRVEGLSGGHSGEDIAKGKTNAVSLLACLLDLLSERTELALYDFDGGMARNAIPAKAQAAFVSAVGKEEMEKLVATCQTQLRETKAFSEPAELILEASEIPEKTFSPAFQRSLLDLLLLLHNGVYGMSQEVPGMVETSANTGKVFCQSDKITVQVLPRSAKKGKLLQLKRRYERLAHYTGFQIHFGEQSPEWAPKKDSMLQQWMTTVFMQQNSCKMKVTSIHAGLECGWFTQKNPQLEMVSVGVTAIAIHTPQEKIRISTIAPQVRLLLAVLEKIAKA